MASFHVLTGPGERVEFPAVRRIGPADLGAALAAGWRDFWEKPSHLVFLGLIYPFMGVVIAIWSSGINAWPLLFPLISGFALVGPIAALPLYETSRRRELGLEADWTTSLQVFRSPAIPSIAAIGALLLVIFTVWLMVAQFLYESLFGFGSPASLAGFANEVFSTPQGQSLMLWGNLIGFAFAVLVLACAVISIPLLLDRDVVRVARRIQSGEDERAVSVDVDEMAAIPEPEPRAFETAHGAAQREQLRFVVAIVVVDRELRVRQPDRRAGRSGEQQRYRLVVLQVRVRVDRHGHHAPARLAVAELHRKVALACDRHVQIAPGLT